MKAKQLIYEDIDRRLWAPAAEIEKAKVLVLLKEMATVFGTSGQEGLHAIIEDGNTSDDIINHSLEKDNLSDTARDILTRLLPYRSQMRYLFVQASHDIHFERIAADKKTAERLLLKSLKTKKASDGTAMDQLYQTKVALEKKRNKAIELRSTAQWDLASAKSRISSCTNQINTYDEELKKIYAELSD